MLVGCTGTIDELDGDAWTRFAVDAGITLPFLRRRGAALIGAVERSCADVPSPEKLHQRITLRAGMFHQSLSS